MAIRVPDTNTFKLSDVITAVEDHAGAIDDKLTVAFTNSIDSYFDPLYKGSKDRQSNFRNYGPKFWDIEGFSLDFSVAPQYAGGANYCIAFNSTGTKMFILGSSSYRSRIFEYTLSNAWDASSYNAYTAHDFSSHESYPHGIFFKSDGTKLYLVGTGNDKIYQFALGNAWSFDSGITLEYPGDELDVSLEDGNPMGLFIKPDGYKVFVLGQTNKKVYEYEPVSAWIPGTSNYYGNNFYIGGQELYAHALFFKSDGTKLYIVGLQKDEILQYTLSTPWDVTSGSYDGMSLYIGSVHEAQGLFFKPDGARLYTVGQGIVAQWSI